MQHTVMYTGELSAAESLCFHTRIGSRMAVISSPLEPFRTLPYVLISIQQIVMNVDELSAAESLRFHMRASSSMAESSLRA